MSTIKKFPKRFLKTYELEHEQKNFGTYSGKVSSLINIHAKTRYEILEDIINQYKYKTIAELGCGDGLPALYLLENCPSITEYVAIDPSPNMYNTHPNREFAADEFNSFNKGVFINKTAYDSSFQYSDKYFDLVYVDHLVHVDDIIKNKDLETWIKKVKPGGTLCGHDYDNIRDTHASTVKIIKKLFNNFELIPELQNNIWIVKL